MYVQPQSFAANYTHWKVAQAAARFNKFSYKCLLICKHWFWFRKCRLCRSFFTLYGTARIMDERGGQRQVDEEDEGGARGTNSIERPKDA